MALKAVNYDDKQHAVYRNGRAMPAGQLQAFMDLFAAQLPERRPLAILDLGSGIGRLTPGLADAFGGPVTGVEPSAKMREAAEAGSAHPAVTYMAGHAAAIPLPDASVDAVLMFLSFHHYPDRAAAAAEIRRVLKPGGRVLMRSNFRDRLPPVWFHKYFPGATAIEQLMFPSVADVEAVFAPVGLKKIALLEPMEAFFRDAETAVAQLRLKAISTFEHLTEEETDAGFAALDAEIAAGTFQTPPPQRSDVLVLG